VCVCDERGIGNSLFPKWRYLLVLSPLADIPTEEYVKLRVMDNKEEEEVEETEGTEDLR